MERYWQAKLDSLQADMVFRGDGVWVWVGYSRGDVVFCVTAREVRLLRDTGRPSWAVSRPIWCSVEMGCGCGWVTVVVMLCSMLQ